MENKVDDKTFKENFLSDLFSKDEGIQKQASADLDQWLQTYQRQGGIWRQVVPPKSVTEADFGDAVDTREPFIMGQIMPESLGAATVNFDTGTQAVSMYAEKYRVFLQRIWTPKYRIDKIYLAGYNGDIIQIFKDLSLQDILDTEDDLGWALCRWGYGDKRVFNEDIGINQYIDAGAEITPDSVAHAVEGLTLSTRNMSPSQALVHRSFWWKIIASFKATFYGDRLAEEAVLGKTAVLEESLCGIKWRTCLDRALIPMNAVVVLAAPKYIGDFFTYGDTEVFTDVTDNIWFEMFTHETIGLSMPFRGCVTRADFGTKTDADDWLHDYSQDPSSSSSSSSSSN